MIVTKAGVEKMVLAIVGASGYGESGHDQGVHRDVDIVTSLGDWIKKAPDSLEIPDVLIPFLRGSVLATIIEGYGHPLNYLCSDCRYPKWFMTPDEARRIYDYNPKYVEECVSDLRPDGFTKHSAGCPECGD